MTALEIARANVATAALERCLRMLRRGGFCSRLAFPRPNVGLDFELTMRLGAIASSLTLVLVAWVISR